MEFEVEQRTGAEYGERSADRGNSRNGYRDRLWETRAGSMIVATATYRPGLSVRCGFSWSAIVASSAKRPSKGTSKPKRGVPLHKILGAHVTGDNARLAA